MKTRTHQRRQWWESRKFDPKTMQNESKTAPKQNQAKPRGPHGNRVKEKVGFWRFFGSLGIALGALLLHFGSPWSIFCSSWGRFGPHFSILMAVGWAWKLNQCIFDHFWSHFASKNIEKTMPKQVWFRIRTTSIFTTRLQ